MLLLAAYWLLPNVARSLDTRLQAMLLQSEPPTLTTPITLIALDEAAIDRMGPWPWPRSVWAELLAGVRQRHEPALLALDVVFPVDPSQRVGNQELASVLAQGPSVIGQLLLPEPVDRGLPVWTPLPSTPNRSAASRIEAQLPDFSGVLANAPPLAQSSSVGHINAVIDPDGVMRKAPAWLCQTPPDTCSQSLALAMMDVLLGSPDWQLRRGRWYALEPAWMLSPAGLPELTIPLDEHLQSWIPWQAEPWLPYFSAADLWDDNLEPGALSQRILLFGGVTLGLGDIATSPLQRTVPGMEVHAHLMQGWLADALPYEPRHSPLLALMLAALVAVGLMLVASQPRRVAWAGGLACLMLIVAVVLAWHLNHIMLPFAPPLFFAFSATALLMTHGAVRERRAVLERIEPYLPPPLRRLLTGGGLRIADETGWGTILVADILGYTRVSRTLPLGQVATWCDRGIDHIIQNAQNQGGLLDNVAGDGALLLWRQGSDIEQAAAAAAAARAILAGLPAVNRELAAQGLPPLAIGIGIHAGPYLLGSFGSGQKRYTVVSEAANLAAHIERQTRLHPWPLLFSQTVAEALPPDATQPVAKLQLDATRVMALYTLTHLPAYDWPIPLAPAAASLS